jgi:hypothetical protein
MEIKSVLKDVTKVSALPVVFASLCCSSPIILFLLGLSSATVASTLAIDLYGNYAWYFRFAGIVTLGIALYFYLRNTKGICTLDAAKRRRNEILNILIVSLTTAILGYMLFTYVILHYIGVLLKLWS